MSFPKRLFPHWHVPNVRAFYLINIFQSTYFIEGVWFFYWARFTSYTNIGLIFSLLTVFRLLLNIPTGVFADRYGRKKSVVLGSFCMAMGGILIALAQNTLWLIAGGLVSNIGRAFISGALEALTYDSLKKDGLENDFARVLSFNIQSTIAVFAVCVLIGGFLYPIYFRLPHLLQAGAQSLAFIFSLSLIELPLTSPKIVRNLISQNIQGFRELLEPNLRKYLVPALTILLAFFLYDWGLSKPAMAVNFGFFSREQSIVFAIMAVANVWVVGKLPMFRRKTNDLTGITSIGLIMGMGFILAYFHLGWFGIIPLMLIELSGYLAKPWISAIVNQQITSQFRATTLSTLEIMAQMPYLLLNFLFGLAIDRGFVNQFHFSVGIAMIVIILFGFILIPRHHNIHIPK